MTAQDADAVRYVTFHNRAVKEGDGVYLQPNESIVAVEYDASRRTHYVQIMCPIDLPFDGGTAAQDDGGGA